jgi:hypothetical protein
MKPGVQIILCLQSVSSQAGKQERIVTKINNKSSNHIKKITKHTWIF